MSFTKALTIGIVPQVSSETKSHHSPRAKRATIMPRSATAAISRVQSTNFVPYISLAMVAAFIFMVGFHLFMINAYATKGLELKKHQQAVRELNSQQKTLMVEQSALGSISKVNDVAGIYGLVPVTDEEFLNTAQLSSR
jgi:hypothetical protein